LLNLSAIILTVFNLRISHTVFFNHLLFQITLAFSPRLDSLLFNNLKSIENVHAPVAIVHGFDDDVIDISSAELLHSRIPHGFKHSPLYLSAGHNDIYDEGNLDDVTKYLQTFLQTVQASSADVSVDALPD
jgi:fermentation-respiration switch protein FrsA (DUF1100 family)